MFIKLAASVIRWDPLLGSSEYEEAESTLSELFSVSRGQPGPAFYGGVEVSDDFLLVCANRPLVGDNLVRCSVGKGLPSGLHFICNLGPGVEEVLVEHRNALPDECVMPFQVDPQGHQPSAGDSHPIPAHRAAASPTYHPLERQSVRGTIDDDVSTNQPSPPRHARLRWKESKEPHRLAIDSHARGQRN